MFRQLDRNGDSVLTPAELSRTDELVAKLDRDEDELVSLDELTPDRSPLADRVRIANTNGNQFDASNNPAVPLTSTEARINVAARLIYAFGTGAPRKIGPDPLGADVSSFRSADSAAGDGFLDRDELMRYLESPTTQLELVISFAPTRSGQGRIERAPGKVNAAPAGWMLTRTGANGALVIEFAGSQMEFVVNETVNNLAGLIERQFKIADANKDGVIDAKELRANSILQQFHAAGDRNHDGRLTESELKAYLDLTNAGEEARIVLTVSDQGIALHERFDTNHDGRLSVRELRNCLAIMASLDADHDGRFSYNELPRRTQLNFGRGPFQNRNRVVATSSVTSMSGDRSTLTLPAWFVAMDRNHDGDVSQREFLGTSEQFRHFDTDGDGLIGGDEAVKSL